LHTREQLAELGVPVVDTLDAVLAWASPGGR
jgi:hypothetical protein